MKKRNELLKTFILMIFSLWISFTASAQWAQFGGDINGEDSGDLSGLSVSLNASGDIVAIGAIFNSDNGTNAGQVRIYENVAGSWAQVGDDIEGEAAGDLSGYSVSMNANGDIVAIGAPENDGNGTNAGHVRVFENIGGTWTQIGGDIDGEHAGDKSGYTVALNAAGDILVIGAPENDDAGTDAGHVRVYENIAGTWTQIGVDIDGEAAGDNSGFSVSTNSIGSIVAIGAPSNGSDAGHVRVYENIAGTWTQTGSDIDGEASGNYSGWSVDLNGDGTTLAIGAPFNSDNGILAGHARIYENVAGTWTQVGADIDGKVANDKSGISVSINSDGNIVSIGSYKNKDNGVNSGQVRVFENESGSWSQLGDDIDGNADQGRFGWSVSLNNSGSIFASSAPYNGSDKGEIRTFCYADFMVFLKDSNGDPLAGGKVEYRDGTWETAHEVSDGAFCINTDRSNVKLRTTFAGATMLETIPTTADYTIQTVLTTFELRKRTGDLGYNWAEVSYVGINADPLGLTGEDGLGLLIKELLPSTYTFKMRFGGGANEITQDITVDPVVTWTMTRMLVQVNKSDGTRGINGVEVTFRDAWLETMGETGHNGDGRIRKDMLPSTYQFKLKYLGGELVEDDFEVIEGIDNELIIDAEEVTVELLDFAAGSPLDGGEVQIWSDGANPASFGTTGDSGAGIVTHDVLPLVYNFKVTYNGDTDTKNVDCTSGAWVTFIYDDFLKSAGFIGQSDFQLVAYPNPFAGNTSIAFGLERDGKVNIAVYDVNGKLVEVLHEGMLEKGNHKLTWNANDIPKGIYFVRFSSEGKVSHQNIVKM